MGTSKERLAGHGLINLAIFSICLSEEWGTKERHVLRDAKIALKAGASVYLYCYKDTIIDIKAKELGVQCLYHQGKASTKLFKWHKLNSIPKLLRSLKINLVHVYDIKFLWPMSFFLRSDQITPLVYSGGNLLKRFYTKMYYRPLVSRIDKVLLQMADNEENIARHLGLPRQRIEFCGMGLDPVNGGKGEISESLKFENNFVIGSSISGQEKDLTEIRPLIKSFQILLQKNIFEYPVKLVLACEKQWDRTLIFEELKNLIWEFSLGEHILFYDEGSVLNLQPHVDLWVGLAQREELEDRCVEALMNETPVVFPRRGPSIELLGHFEMVGETYRDGDIRELTKKIEKILTNLPSYKKALKKHSIALRKDFGIEVYQNLLLETYSQVISRRARLFRHRLKGT